MALKQNDEDGYRKLLLQAKNERLSTLLAQTDAYLEQIGKLLHVQKERDEIGEKKKEREERNKRFMERKELEKLKKMQQQNSQLPNQIQNANPQTEIQTNVPLEDVKNANQQPNQKEVDVGFPSKAPILF